MKKLLSIILAGFATMASYSQCAFNNSFYIDATPPCPGTMTAGCVNPGEYVSVNVVAGNTYEFTTCGGTLFTDTELTLYDAFGFTVIDYNDDDCGTQSTITWVATFTGTVNLLLDEFPCSSSGSCVDIDVTCSLPVQSGNGCNTDITICTPGTAGPFAFNTPGAPVSSCLDFIGPDYAYIVLYITSSGPLQLLIDGDAATGFLDVAIFDVPAGDPCNAINNVGNEISCNYADFANGCNQFGTFFPCTSSVPSPNVVAGDVLMIVVENWSGASTTFTMDLAPPPAAQTGPPDPTINPAGPLCSTDPAIQMTAVNMGGDWSGPGVSATGSFNPATAGVGTHTINYVIGQPPCQSSSSTSVQVIDCSAPCSITNLTANIGACVVGLNTYSTTGQVAFVNPPAGGQLIVEDCNGVQQVFNAPFVSPINYNLTGQNANGLACDVTAYFSADLACTQTIAYTAPICTCNIDNFTANIGACLSNNTFDVTGTVTYSSPPAAGTLIVEVDNGTSTFTTTINLPFTSPDNYTITGIPSDGSAITITTYFSALPGCTNTINSTAPPSCACGVDIGTFNSTITGSSTNNFVLCYGDQIDINSNMDFTPPAEQFAPPGPPYDPGVSWLIYSCPPTVALVPNLITDIPDDPCFLGLLSDFDLSDLNDLGMINSFPPGTFANNTIYYVPITMYSMSSGTYSYVNTTMPCYELGTPFAVQYLPDFNFAIVQNCNTGTATITVSGGLPEVNGSNFTASNLLPATASFTSTTAPNNGSFVINGLTGGQNYSFTVNDGNGCPYTITGGPFPPLQNPGFNYANTTLCVTSAAINPVITGAAGGTFTSTPAGLTINAATGQITPTTSTVGAYNVTYTTPGPCPDDSTLVINIITTPVANAGPDVSICPGTGITLNGSGLGTPSWAPGATLSATNILNPVATPLATTTYTLTLNAAGCIDTDDVTVTLLNPAPIVVSPDVAICEGDCTTLTVAGGDFFVWDPNAEILDSSLTSQTVCPTTTTTYTVTSYTEGTNLVTNGDFSSGNTGFNSTYTFFAPINTAEAQYNVLANPAAYNGGFSVCGDHTSGAGNMMVVNGSSVVGASVWCQTIPVTPNADYLFSAWLTSVFAVNPAQLQFTINGTPIGGDLNANAVTCTWDEFFSTWNSGAATSATICITNLNTNVMGNDFAIDDISFTPICEQVETITVTVNPLPIVDAGPDQTLCAGDQSVLNGSGATTYVWDNGVTDGVSFTPAATATYTVTGTGAGGCQGTDQATVTVNPVPIINAGPDQIICIGDPVTLTASGAGIGGVYAWDNGVTDGLAFNPIATNTYTVTGTNSGLCSATDQVTVTINPLDDPSFNYPSGLTYCQTAADPTALVTGLAGGIFSFTVVSGGPTLVLNTTSGLVDLSASDLGTYAITYNTSGAPGSLCPQTSTLNMTITDAPIADFTFGTYCSNDLDPNPTFINGGSGGIFTALPAGLSINAATGLVDLSASAPGTYTITNTINIPGCALATFDDDIIINGLPAGTISGTTTICPGDPLPDITINLTAGLAPWDLTYNYNGAPVNVVAAAPTFTITGAAIGSYDLVSVTDANGCTNALVGNATISTFPTPIMTVLNDQEICEGQNLSTQVFGSNIAGSTFDWTNITGIDIGFGLSGTGNIPIFLAQNGTGVDITATVQVTPTSPQGCIGLPVSFDITIHANPIVSFVADTLNGCSPFVVNFTNTSSIPGQDCIWDFGTGPNAFGCGGGTNTFNTGSYDVTLSVTSVDGCFGTATISSYINVFDTPVASFSYAPQILDIGDTEVDFTNHSDFADTYQWDFGDTTPYVFQINPTHTYPEVPNSYLATLIASNNNGMCADTAQQLITIQDVLIFYVPNVFTPDHDEFNEGFIPIFTSGYDPFDYHLTIFNRWGEIVFESYDATKGWDGTYSDQGLVQDGVYVWQIEFKETMSDKRHTYRGHVTVLK
jgi:gliding motility-associated-like protein